MDDDRIDPAHRGPVPPDPLYLASSSAVEAAAAQREHVVALVEELALTEARIAALHAHQVSVLSDLQVHPYVTTTGLDVADELVPRLRWTAFTTDRRLATAARVAACFPVLFQDLSGAEIDYHRLDVVVHEADLLDEEQARVLDAVLSGRLAGLTTAQIKHLVRREIAVIDSQAVKERARRVVAERRIAYTALPDGQGLLEVLGPAPAVRAAYDHLDAVAKGATHPGATTDPYAIHPRPGPGPGLSCGGTSDESAVEASHDERGIDARRFDLCIASMTTPLDTRPGAAAGTGPQITIAWPAAVGLDDLPAHLSGHGAIPAETVRHLLQHTGFRKAATHPTTGHITATDGHLHPAGLLPDLTRSPVERGASEPASTRERTRVTTPGGAVGRPPGGAPALPTRTTAASSANGIAPRTASPGAAASAVGGSRTSEHPPPADRRGHVRDVRGIDDDLGGVEPFTDGGRRRLHDAPHEVPDEVAPAGPGPGGSDELGGHDDGYDDGYDVPTVSGPDTSDLDAYVTRVLVDTDEAFTTDVPPSTGPSRDTLTGQIGALHPEVIDPTSGPRADEFEVTLAITASRPATLVNSHRAHDTAAWIRRAERRARSALVSCPTAADPAHPYRFSAALRRFLVLRSPTCTAPGCRAPAHRCDLDHTTAHAAGGPTCTCNAGPLCRRHHTAKHTAWTVTRTHDDPDDPSLTWLSPLGYLYTVPPTPLFPPVPAVITAHLADRRTVARALERRPAPPGAGAASGSDDGGGGDDDGGGSNGGGGSDGGAALREGDSGGDRPHTPTVTEVTVAHRRAVDHQWDRDCRACDPARPPVLHRPRPTPVDAEDAGHPGVVHPGGGGADLPGRTLRALHDPDGDPPF